jgi:uncharacterized MAPEG superfamily protein
MPVELRIAAFGAVLLFVHVFATIRAKTAQYGRAWNISPRDEPMAPPTPMVGRLERAQANFAESFPIAVVALLGVVIAERTSEWTALGGWIWLGARIAYLPVYALGVTGLRTLIYAVSIAGLGMTIWPLLAG